MSVTASVSFTTTSANTQSNFTVNTPFTRAGITTTYPVGSGNVALSFAWRVPARVYFLGNSNGAVTVDFISGNGTGTPTNASITFQYDVRQ